MPHHYEPDPIWTLSDDDLHAIGDPSRRPAWLREQMHALMKERNPDRFGGRLALLNQIGDLVRSAAAGDVTCQRTLDLLRDADPDEELRDYGF